MRWTILCRSWRWRCSLNFLFLNQHFEERDKFWVLPISGTYCLSYHSPFLVNNYSRRYSFYFKNFESFTFWIKQNRERIVILFNKILYRFYPLIINRNSQKNKIILLKLLI